MANPISFNYATKNSFVSNLLALALLAPFACLISIVVFILLSAILDVIFSTTASLILSMLLFLGIVIISWLRRTALTSLTIDETKLTWKETRKKVQTVYSDEIKAIEPDHKKMQLTINNALKLPLKALPLKKRIELSQFLPQWLPEDSLPLEYEEFLDWKTELESSSKQEPFTIKAYTNRRRARLVRTVVLTAVTIILGLLIWLISSAAIQEAIVPITLIGVVSFFVSFTIWQFTKYRCLQVDENGLTYRNGAKEHFFDWNNIDTLAFRAASQHLLIWKGDRYKSYSYRGMDAKMVNETANTIVKQATIRNIPIAVI